MQELKDENLIDKDPLDQDMAGQQVAINNSTTSDTVFHSNETTVGIPVEIDVVDSAQKEEESLADQVKILSPMQLVLKRFFRSKLSVIGLSMILFLVLFSFLGPLLRFTGLPVFGEIDMFRSTAYNIFVERVVYYTVYDYYGVVVREYYFYYVTYTRQIMALLHQPVARTIDAAGNPVIHLLGTCEQSHDIFSRLMYGGRISLIIAFTVVFSSTAIGVLLGSVAGYFGKWVDQVIMRIVDIFMCIPTLPILLIVGSIMDSLGASSMTRIVMLVLVMALLGWAGTTRLVRGQILMLREQEYMLAAEAMGLSSSRRIMRHLIPNVMPQLIVSMTLQLGGVILTEATLSFLGFGVQMPLAAWGTMIGRLADFNILVNHFHLWGPPGLLIMMAVLGFNFIGDGLRDAFDPKMKR